MANTKRVQFRRGTEAEHQVFTGAEGEITVNTSNNTVRVHDGLTPGGTEAARNDFNNVTAGIITGTLSVSGVTTENSWRLNVGVGTTAGIVASGGMDVYGTTNIDGNTSIDGRVNVSGSSTLTNWSVSIGSGTTDVIIDGDVRVTGILSVGQNTVTIDGNNNAIVVSDLTAGRVTSTDFNFISVASTIFEHQTRTSDNIAIGSTIIPIQNISTVQVDDLITILSTSINQARIVGVTTALTIEPFGKILKTTETSGNISVGSTTIPLLNGSGVSIGSSIEVVGFIAPTPIVGLSSQVTSTTNTFKDASLNVLKDAIVGDTAIAIGSTTNVAIGDSVSSGSLIGASFSQDGNVTLARVVSIGTTNVGTYRKVTYTTTLSQVASSGSSSVTVDQLSRVSTSHKITLVGYTNDLTITAIDAGSNQISLSEPLISEIPSGTSVEISLTTQDYFNATPSQFTSVGAASSGSNTIVLNSVSLVSAGNSLSVFPQTFSEEVYNIRINSVDTNTDTVTIDGTFPYDISDGTSVEVSQLVTSHPSVTLNNPVGAALTAGVSALGVYNAVDNYSVVAFIGFGATASTLISTGSVVSISTFTNLSDALLIRPGFAHTDSISIDSNILIERQVSNDTNINPNSSEIRYLNVTGIATIGELTFPEFDGREGQVLQTDGQGNIIFGVGGKSGSDTIIFVSATNGDDENDGILQPVKTIKRASQLASLTQKTEVTILVETGEYIEDNPIIVYDNVSIIGDSLRNIVVRPLNSGKDLFLVRNGTYLTGMTFNDYVDGITRVPQHTWDYSVAFDDPYDTSIDRTGYASTSVLTITNAEYTKETGITTITVAEPHQLYRGNTVRVAGIAWTCGYDETAIKSIVYNNTTGISTISFYSDPKWIIGEKIYLNNLPFKCTDEHLGVTTTIFPYPGLDPIYGAVYPITGVNTATKTVTIQGGITTIPHIYAGWDRLGISTFEYDNVSGICTVVTNFDHNLLQNDNITLQNLPFSCSVEHAGVTTTIFPDGTINTQNKDGYTFKVASEGVVAQVTNAIYDGVSGITTITSPLHGMTTGDKVKLVDESIVFTCDSDGNQFELAHPRPTDPVSGVWLPVTVIDANAFSINVGDAGDASTFIHTFVRAEPNALRIGPNKFTVNVGPSTIPHVYEGYNDVNVTAFEYDAISGISTLTTNATTGVSTGGFIHLDGLNFTCPGQSLGFAKSVIAAHYNHITGITTIVISGSHGFEYGSRIKLEGLNFECNSGGGISTSAFPSGALGYDFTVSNVINSSTFVVNVGVSTIPHTYVDGGTAVRYYTPKVAVSTATYDHTTGVTVITSPGSYFESGEIVYLENLVFECNSGGGLSTAFFPSGTLGYGFTVTSVSNPSFNSFTFSVNVGVSTIPHTYVNGGTVQSGITTTVFPDGTGFPSDAFEVLEVVSPTVVKLQVGPSPIQHTYVSGGTASQTPIAQKVGTSQAVRLYPELHKTGKIDFGVVNFLNDYQFLFRGETNDINHYYTQGGTARLTKPKINKSPYIQNCSILSSLGGNGILVDGDKIIDENRGLIPELGEIPVILPSPEFGKSMVAATFTMISFGGIGWRTINDGYAQVVSCFQIFCEYGSLCQSGGYLSITNSATNFGRYSLRATGYSRNSFSFDRGRIVDTGTSGGLQTLKVIGLGRSDQQLYVLKFLDNNFKDVTPEYKPLAVEQTFTGANISTATNTFNIPAHPFQNLDSIIYSGNEDANPPDLVEGLINNGIYYVGYINASNFQLYLDEGLDTLVNIGSTITGINTFTKNPVEFFTDDIIEHHTSYQQLSLAGVGTTSNWVSGRAITQTVNGGNASGYALTYVSSTNSLIVSVESVGGTRNFFSTTNPILDHSDTPISIGVTAVAGVTTYHTMNFKVASTDNQSIVIGIGSLPETYRCHFHRPSIINSSAHTWEYSGSGTDYNALPQNGGKTVPGTEQVSELGGRVFASGTTELGDFKIGDQITAFNRTGNIVFNNKVTIGELDSIRLSLSGGVAVEEFSTDVGLGENEVGGPQHKRVSTQLAVRSFLANRLGTFIDKVVSTNAVPNAVVQLNANGQINADLIPPKVVNFLQTNVGSGRTVLVNEIPAFNIIQGDTVVEPDDAYVLVNDTLSQYLILDNGNTVYNFNNNDEVTSALSSVVTGVVTAPPSGIGIGTTIANYTGYGNTGYVSGVALGLQITQAGSGYNAAGIYTGIPVSSVTGIGTDILATITVNVAGNVTAIDVLAGGRYYAVNDVITVSNPNLIGGRTGGADFQARVTEKETRLYLQLTNNQKFAGSPALSDYIEDANAVSISTSLTSSYSATFTPTDIGIGGDVNFTNSTITVGANQFADGDPIIYNAQGNNPLIASGQGILDLNVYYVKLVGAGTSVELHRNYQLTNKITFSGSGTGTHELRRDGVIVNKNTIVSIGHPFTTGTAIRVSGSTPVGVDTGSFYYTGSVTPNAFTLHATASDANFSVNGVSFNEVGIADTSSGTISFTESNVKYSKTVNTSSSSIANWSLLARQDIDAANIISGTINPSRLGGGAANSDTVLTGSSSYQKNVFKVGIATNSPLTVSSSSQEFPNAGVGIITHYGNLVLGIQTAFEQGLNAYSSLGLAKYKTSTFGITADGGVFVKTAGNGGDIDAASIETRNLAYILNSANHTGAVPVTRGGTGLEAAPAAGHILVGNGTGYNLTNSPTISGVLSLTSTTAYPLTFNSTQDAKIVLGGASNPYIRWREGTTDRAYIQWSAGNDALLYRNQQGAYHDFMGNTTNPVGLRLRTSDNNIRGYVYATSSNEIGFLDQGGSWAIRHVNDNGSYFYTDNSALEFRVGRDAVSGQYGVVETNTTRNGWGGYSINGRCVFMHNHSNDWGIYDDVNNQWLLQGTGFGTNRTVQLNYNNAARLVTNSSGVSVTGNMIASSGLVQGRNFIGGILNTTSNSSFTVDINTTEYIRWESSFTANRIMDINNFTAGKRIVIYVRNANATTRNLRIRCRENTSAGLVDPLITRASGSSPSTLINANLNLASGHAVTYVIYSPFNRGYYGYVC
jgi:hypothetical protein